MLLKHVECSKPNNYMLHLLLLFTGTSFNMKRYKISTTILIEGRWSRGRGVFG